MTNDTINHMALNRTFREPKSVVEESEILENALPRSTRLVNKWAMKIFGEWQAGRTNKKACEEESGSAVETSQIQDLETNICGMTAESLNFWLTKFIIEVCKDTGETYPPRMLYSIFSGIQRHLENCNHGNAVKFMGKMDNRYAFCSNWLLKVYCH